MAYLRKSLFLQLGKIYVKKQWNVTYSSRAEILTFSETSLHEIKKISIELTFLKTPNMQNYVIEIDSSEVYLSTQV